MDRNTAIYSTLLTSLLSLSIWFYWRSRKTKKIPKKWRRVGELSDIVCYPVKSLGPIRLKTMECTELGLRAGWLRDRNLMIIDDNNKFVTARDIPKMILITPSVRDSILTLKASGMNDFSLDLSKIDLTNSLAIQYRETKFEAYYCGDEVSQWLSKCLLEKENGLRLIYHPFDKSLRIADPKLKIISTIRNEDMGAYPDYSSYNLQNQASVDDLNSRVEDTTITTSNFRPNFVVKGPKAYDEDNWEWVKIGNIVFENVKPCTRCVLTTVDPVKGEKNSNLEPLKTLRKYRQIEDPKIRSLENYSPKLGIHLALRSPLKIVHVGDSVYINDD